MVRLIASAPPTSSPTATKRTIRVSSSVVNTDRAPTSPNHSQSTYVSSSLTPSSSASTITAAMMRRIRLRRDSFRLTGGRVATATLLSS